MFLGTKNQNEGTFGCSPVHSPKPPFYETTLLFPLDILGDNNRTQTFSSQTFSGTPGISRPKSQDIPPKSLASWAPRDIPNFLAPTLLVETPIPPKDIQTKQFGFGFLFSCLSPRNRGESKGMEEKARMLR